MPRSTKAAHVPKERNPTSIKKSSSKAARVEPKSTIGEIATPHVLKRLVDNDEEVRTKALHTVAQKLTTSRGIEEFELQKLWKGLWFTMWHSDKPALQHALARDLASLFPAVDHKNFWHFVKAFWLIVLREWETLDRYRVDKFLLLVRFALNNILGCTLAGPREWPSLYAEYMVTLGPLNYTESRIPLSLRLHIADIYIDELEKVISAQGTPKINKLKLILEPVLSQPLHSSFKPVKQRVAEDVLTDERLVEWEIMDKKVEKTAEESSDDDDWEGFE